MLTLEQIEEGRQLVADGAVNRPADYEAATCWLWENIHEFLDAAERVARQEAYAAEPAAYDPPQAHEAHVARLRADAERGRLAREKEYAEEQAAVARVLADVGPVLTRMLDGLPIAVERGQYLTNPEAWSLERIERWLLDRGVRARVAMVGRELTFETASLVDRKRPRCPECAGDMGGRAFGRLEDHRPGCPRFPL